MAEERKVLVAEDEMDLLNGLRKSLSKEGYNVDTAEDGLQAVQRIEGADYDIVIADLKMPRMDGMELLRRTRQVSPRTVFIIMTGYGSVESALEAMKLGAFDYIPKPFSTKQLSAVVEKAIRTREVARPVPATVHRIAAENVPLLAEHMMKSRMVVAPVAKGRSNVFATIERVQDIVLDYTSTILPPKKFILPQTEQLLKFDKERSISQSTEIPFEPAVLFGIHPCDMQGILRLDYAFTEGNPEANYITRRKQMIIVGVSCQPDDKCFCQELGSCNSKAGFDIFLTKLNSGYLAEVLTDAGAKLLEGFDRLSSATEKDIDEADSVNADIGRPRTSLGCHVSALPQLFEITGDDHLWKELAQKCLSCGSCNLVCPTCYCFDVTDRLELNLKDGGRYRRWDSCQLDGFAAVATGENFREDREQRLHHRFNRKYMYLNSKLGGPACVGCGRCARACLADINPAEVIAELNRKNELSLMSKLFAFSE
jgi:sulfhydrogenase subunit beta (sulfur reductase)